MKITRRRFLGAGAVLATGIAALDAFWLEQFFIDMPEFAVGKAQKDTARLKIVQISDLHLQSVGYSLQWIARKINALAPDAICITGDAIDKAQNIPVLHEFLSLLSHNILKIATLGNWEHWAEVDIQALRQMYRSHNCTLLINEAASFVIQHTTVSFTGVDDYTAGQANIGVALSTHQPGDFHIILNHSPRYTDMIAQHLEQEKIPADLILSGHTHGGQINLFGFIPFLPQGSGRYVKGWYHNHSVPHYVSKGVGTSILPIRFGVRAEVAAFYLGSSLSVGHD